MISFRAGGGRGQESRNEECEHQSNKIGWKRKAALIQALRTETAKMGARCGTDRRYNGFRLHPPTIPSVLVIGQEEADFGILLHFVSFMTLLSLFWIRFQLLETSSKFETQNKLVIPRCQASVPRFSLHLCRVCLLPSFG